VALELFSILAPLFICAGIGFLWARRGQSYDRELTTSLIMNVGAPCLVFSKLASLEVDPLETGRMIVGALMAMGIFAGIGWIVLRLVRLPAHTYMGPLVFANTGNLGLPLCFFAFGSAGLALATAWFACVTLTHYSLGIWLWSGRASFRELLRTPLAWAAALAMAVSIYRLPLPVWIQHTTSLLGGLTIPLMLLMLGVSLNQLHTKRLLRAFGLAGLRVGMGLAVGAFLARELAMEGVARNVLIVECSMPAAVFNYVMAQRYRRSPDDVANIVVLSSLIVFAVLPLLLGMLLKT